LHHSHQVSQKVKCHLQKYLCICNMLPYKYHHHRHYYTAISQGYSRRERVSWFARPHGC